MKIWNLWRSGICLAVVVLFVAWGTSASGDTIRVKNTWDSPTASCFAGDASCTLREAIKYANLLPGEDTVIVPAGLYGLSIEGPGEDVAASGDLDVTDDLILLGAGMDETIIDGLGLDRVFDIRGDISVTILNVTIIGGVAPDVYPDLGGGGIRLRYDAGSPSLALQHTRLTNNRATFGAGLSCDGARARITIQDSDIRNNALLPAGSPGSGSGLNLHQCGEFGLYRSTVANNLCSGVSCYTLNITSCADHKVQIENSTIRNPGYDGVRLSNCDARITQSTIAENRQGLVFGTYQNVHTLSLRSTIIAYNQEVDCNWSSGIIDTAGGFNLDSDGTCGLNALLGDQPDTDPQLGPFGGYTSPTPGYHPQPGSPVIDTIAYCATTMDQDRFERPDGDQAGGGLCDLGSIEVLPCGDGAPSIILLPGVYSSGSWEACNALKAIGVEVAAGSILRFSARGSITLISFKVPAGSTFSAAMERTAGWNP